jgi:hypothetical protein
MATENVGRFPGLQQRSIVGLATCGAACEVQPANSYYGHPALNHPLRAWLIPADMNHSAIFALLVTMIKRAADVLDAAFS